MEHNPAFNYGAAPKEEVPCNLCGARDARILAQKTGSGRSAITRLCMRCGLMFISPRMTRESYRAYYARGYREDRGNIKGEREEGDLEANFRGARKLGNALVKRFGLYLTPGRTLDAGSSTGGVLVGLREALHGIVPFGLEPSEAEAEFARAKGIPTERALVEDVAERASGGEPFANILCVRSLNHLLDPRLFLEWCVRALQPQGRLVLEVKNFRHQARRANSLTAGIQVDHPYMFVPETLRLLVEISGFEVVAFDVDEWKTRAAALAQRSEGLSIHHVRLVARKRARVETASEREAHIRRAGPPIARRLKRALSPLSLHTYFTLYYAGRLRSLRRFFPSLDRN